MAALTPKLFWCWTDDGEEDWFVVASNPRDAAAWFEEQAGYVPGEAQALEIAPCAGGCDPGPGWVDLASLHRSGFELLRVSRPRVVRRNHVLFVEGMADTERQRQLDDALEAKGRGRPNGTRPKSEA